MKKGGKGWESFFWWVILFVIAYFLNAARDYTAAFDDLTKMQANRTETCPGISKLDVNRSLSKKIFHESAN